ncbi:MAG: hypothetical protein ACUVT9_06220 [Candidatus Bathycorpusculaceae bacterium]
MKKYKVLGITLTLVIFAAFIAITKAQTVDEMEIFFQKDYAGLSIIVNATAETVPGGNLTTKIWINCTATGVAIECLNISIYGFRGGQEKLPLNSTCFLENKTLQSGENRIFDLIVELPLDVWGRTQAELYLEYYVQSDHFIRDPVFSLTNVRNIYYEKLQEDFRNLNESYHLLNDTYWQLKSDFEELNQSYINLQQEYATLNQTYWELKGSLNELDSTRRLAVILGITTVFFVATTVFLVMRRPKQYW